MGSRISLAISSTAQMRSASCAPNAASARRTWPHAAGVTTGTLSVIERGKSNPAWGTVKGIAKALDVPVADLAKLEASLDR
ncbi:MAG: helix-turn-helix transcriptional regulator [Thermoleophilaceae bacterium]